MKISNLILLIFISRRNAMKKKLSPISLVYLLFSVGTAAMLLSLVMSRGEFLEKIVYDFSYLWIFMIISGVFI